MNCEQFERLIALQVEGDLPENQQSKLSKHLLACGSCHRFAEEIRDSQASLRSYTGEDFDETLLAGIRHNVMSQIHTGVIALSRWERIAGWFGVRDISRFIWAIAGAAAILVLTSTIGFYVFQARRPGVEITAGVPKLTIPGPGVSAERPNNDSAGPRKDRPIPRRPQQAGGSTLASNIPPIAPPSSDDVTGSAGTNSQLIASGDGEIAGIPTTKKDVTRIEMQTANPNIRIIWFVDKKPIAPPIGVLSDGEETKF
jgi:hypothetical protein